MIISSARAIKFMRLLKSTKSRHGLRYGVAAAVEHRCALGALDFATVVDIGANKGQFSLFAVDAFPGVTIYAFEPLPVPAARYRSVFYGQQVRFFEAAIGPCEKETTIYVSQREDSSSLLPITKRQIEVFPGTQLKETRIIRVAPLVKFIRYDELRAPALLKIDVQGFELEVLKGCDPLLSSFEYIYVECSFIELYAGQALADDIITYLGQHNFRLAGVYNQVSGPEGRAVQADFLFTSLKSIVKKVEGYNLDRRES
jgi:FkbM family methyltransferase